MWKCPVCNNDNNKKDNFCPQCGFERTMDVVSYRTLSRVSAEKNKILYSKSRWSDRSRTRQRIMIADQLMKLFTEGKFEGIDALIEADSYEEAIASLSELNGGDKCDDWIIQPEKELDIASLSERNVGDKCDDWIIQPEKELDIASLSELNGGDDCDDWIIQPEKELDIESLSERNGGDEYDDWIIQPETGLDIATAVSNIEVGCTVQLGSYQQEKGRGRRKEAIEWIVLEIKDGKALLLSKYGLDTKSFSSRYTNVTWENCTLRSWLNRRFITSAFSREEQECIEETLVTAEANPESSTGPGNDTIDRIFLLSISEAEKYLASDYARECKPTDFAIACGAYVDSDNGNCWWWLRSPGVDGSLAAAVLNDGSVCYNGNYSTNTISVVRPALWLNLESLDM